ncbi:hypothetical protein [Methanomicrobium mobile]|uniref:hypothetical protein n=1 Tax=Methanomicrobium mobile TaxID=2205 RepID=UPI0005B2CE40|nr:hypothetical protein [Methanomicrobium mobile]
MNNYDEQYEFRVANRNDISDIMCFIEKYWKTDHVMAQNRDFFEYEFLEEDGTVNFILAIDKKKGTIECLNGFLKASHDAEHLDVWGSFWKVLEGNMGMLGAELIRRRKELTKCRCDLDVGDNPKTAIPVLKVLLKRYTTKMVHYYILSEQKTYKIAKVSYLPEKKKGSCCYNVVRFFCIEELMERFDTSQYIHSTPYKDHWYINHRFFEHPVYDYEVYGIEKDGRIGALFVLRNQPYDDRVAIRLVDYIGDKSLIEGIGSFLENYLAQSDKNEYIDFYCAGIDEELILSAGFVSLKDGDENIIPNYFGPFVQDNIDIWVDSRDNNSLFMKADGDQDRPNVI